MADEAGADGEPPKPGTPKKKEDEEEEEEDEDGPLLPWGLWWDEEDQPPERQSVMDVLNPNPGDEPPDKEKKVKALLVLRTKSMCVEFREALWADVEVRTAIINAARGPDPEAPQKSLYSDGPEIPDEDVRFVALGTMIQLSMSPENRRNMTADSGVRECFMMGIDKYAAEELSSDFLRQRGYISLVSVILCKAVHPKDTDEFGGKAIINGLLDGMEDEFPADVKASILGTLWTLALSLEADPKALWDCEPLRDCVLKYATVGQDEVLRENALGLLWALACHDPNREDMWHNEIARVVLVESVPFTWSPHPEEEDDEILDDLDALLADDAEEKEEPDPVITEEEGLWEEDEEEKEKYPQTASVRIKGIRALECLATVDVLREEMWAHKPLAVGLLDSVGGSEVHEVRSAALLVLLQLAVKYECHLPMFGSGVHEIFTHCSENPKFSKQERIRFEKTAARIVEGADWAKWWAEKIAIEEEEAAMELALRLAEAEMAAADAFYAEEAALAEARMLAEEEMAASCWFYEEMEAARLKKRGR